MRNIPYEKTLKKEFLEGINEVYSIMFTDAGDEKPLFYLLDESNTVTNIYGETTEKVYFDPISLVAKVVTHITKDELPEMECTADAVFTVPTLQLIDLGIPKDSKEALDVLCKGKFHHKGLGPYEVVRVVPTTLVAGEWQFYVFYCLSPKE